MITMEFVVPANLCGDSQALFMKLNLMRGAFFWPFIVSQIYSINTMQVSLEMNELSMSIVPISAC